MTICARSTLLASSLLVACVGDSTVNGDGGADASMSTDGGSDATTTDTGSDGSNPGDASSEAGDAGCGTQPFASLTANCAQVSCLHATQITCGTTSACGAVGGKALDCGSTSDCQSFACCLGSSLNVTPGCPNDAVVGVGSPVTLCSTNTSKACASNQVQVCLTSAECFTGTCQDTVFDFNGMKTVHFGTCQ